MILSEDQIKEYILRPKNEALIKYLIQEKKRHELHLVGYGIEEFIKTVDKIEDKSYIDVKLKFKNYKTLQLYHKALKPFQSIFTAKGGSIYYDTDNDKVKNKIKVFLNSKIGKKYDLQEWMQKIWLSQVNIDPMGMTLIEYDPETKLPYLDYLSVYKRSGEAIYKQIHDFDYSNITTVEYLILHYGTDKDKNNIYRIIDDKYDYLVKQDRREEEKIEIIDSEIKDNPFGKVPAIINSNRVDNQVLQAKTSYIKESLICAQDYLNDYIDYRIYKKKISIPRIWEFKTACEKCGGTKEIQQYSDLEEGRKFLGSIKCDVCRGTGYHKERSLTDIIRVDLLEAGAQNYIPPTGSVTLPTNIQDQMVLEMKSLEVDIYETIWGQGVFLNQDRANTTAFEVSVRNEQKTHQLMIISDNKILVEQEIINLVGKLNYGSAFKGVTIKAPTQYILNTGTQAMSVYLEAKKNLASDELLNQLYKEYLESEYENNEQELIKNQKLFVVDPFPHNTLLEINDISSAIEFTVKKNMLKYTVRYENEFNRIYLPENTIEKISEQFNEWAKLEINTELETNINENENISRASE